MCSIQENFTISRLKSLILYAILTAQKIQKKPPLRPCAEMMGPKIKSSTYTYDFFIIKLLKSADIG